MNNKIWILLFVCSLSMMLIVGYTALEKMDKDTAYKEYQLPTIHSNHAVTQPAMPMRSVNSGSQARHTRYILSEKPVHAQIKTSTDVFHHRNSSALSRSYNGGTVMNSGLTPDRMYSYSPNYRMKHENSIVSVTPVLYNHVSKSMDANETQFHSMSVRRNPGFGVLDDTVWESWYQRYVNETGSEDLSGLEEWWNTTYGGGYTPDIFTDWETWVREHHAPLPDGIRAIIFMILLYLSFKVYNTEIKRQKNHDR